MEPKSLEYVMGHGDISTTMNVYTHARYDNVEASMGKILKFTTPFVSMFMKIYEGFCTSGVDFERY